MADAGFPYVPAGSVFFRFPSELKKVASYIIDAVHIFIKKYRPRILPSPFGSFRFFTNIPCRQHHLNVKCFRRR
jgi:hypothetical protein